MKGFNLSALVNTLLVLGSGAVLSLSQGAPAAAQNADSPDSSIDSAYLTQLYSFLESQDAVTHAMATQSMSAEDNVWAAQMFCRTFESGVSPADAFTAYTTSAMNQAIARGANMTEEMAFSVGLYGGAVMNIGSTHYCPQYQPQVEQALQSFREIAQTDGQ